ncbi:MFS transporter [Aquitalea aquatica]|uniref:MFS transporter n=1 Tax=Aquitalea aquatica TaxID=3044273 RepID=A0A838Y7U7_9NEIS|nr:MFS transporter [Aquitalea magnusonii]MBA4706791.1 MFS transporter [Aquitalea magnusonii]
MTTNKSISRRRQIIAAVVGNTLEWYDFIVYGFMTSIISKLFFPADGNEFISLLMATATFGVGFFMRPVGGVLLGIYADRKGRKAAMQLIMAIMALVSLLIACAPPYAAIGVAAPLLIVLARLLQGFATGGEYASATAFLVEAAPADQRGLYGSWQLVGQMLAILGGAGMGALITHNLDQGQLESWGWRIPFLIGLLIAPVGWWVRRHMDETEAFLEASQPQATAPGLGGQLQQNRRNILLTIGLTIPGTAGFYVLLVNMPGYVHRQFGLPLDQAFAIQMLAVAWMTVLIPFSGAWSDRIGRRPLLLWPYFIFLLMVYPGFAWLADAPSMGRLLVVQLLFCTLLGLAFGPAPTAVSELFPVRVRSTGVSIGYNLAVMIFGGFAPFIVTWLAGSTGSPIAPVYYLLLSTALGVIACYFLPRGRPETAAIVSASLATSNAASGEPS